MANFADPPHIFLFFRRPPHIFSRTPHIFLFCRGSPPPHIYIFSHSAPLRISNGIALMNLPSIIGIHVQFKDRFYINVYCCKGILSIDY